jgi:hypothetical protein
MGEEKLPTDRMEELLAAIARATAPAQSQPSPVARLIRLAESAGVSPTDVCREYELQGPLAKILALVLNLPSELGVDLGPDVRRGRPFETGTGAMRAHYELVEKLRATGLKMGALREELRKINPNVKPESIIKAHQRYRWLKRKHSSIQSELAKLYRHVRPPEE